MRLVRSRDAMPNFHDDESVYSWDDVRRRTPREHCGRFDSMRAHHRSGRLAGALYLLVVLTGIFTLAYVPSRIPLSGDPAAALGAIRASEPLFRMGIAAFLVMQVSFLLLPLALFPLLRPAGPSAAAAMVALVAASVPVALVSLSARLDLLSLVADARYAAATAAEPLQIEALLAVSRYYNGLTITRLFWGCWLLPLGYLVLKSGLMPRVLGGLLILGGLGYIVDVFGELLVPGYADSLLPTLVTRPAALGEIGTCLWLLVVGGRPTRFTEETAPAGVTGER